MADGVDALVDAVEAAMADPALDCVAAQPGCHQLGNDGDPVLPRGQFRDPGVR